MSATPSKPARAGGDTGGRMAGEYRLGKKLGEGGFGAVYEAEHPVLKRRAAVKVLHRVGDKDSEAVLRFIAEAQAVNQIRNRHIIDVFSFGTLGDGRHFYVMDLLDGVALDRWIEQQGKVDVATALHVLRPIAQALDLAHAAGIVHRDLKPQNIFLAWEPSGEMVPKLLDFGMAKLLGESPVHTVSGTPLGTPLYMSPEQAKGSKVDQRSDVYALGVVCHELLTGQLPFMGESTMAVLMAHVIQPAPRVSEVEPSVPSELDEPLLRMLAKDPDGRPGGAGAALDGLERAAEAAGIVLKTGAIFLPRAESRPPAAADDAWPLTTSAALSATQPQQVTTAPSRQRRGVPFWAFALAFVVLGVAFGAAYIRQAQNGKQAELAAPEGSPASAMPAPAALPSARTPKAAAFAAPRPATSLEPGGTASGRPLGNAEGASSAPSAARVPDLKPFNKSPKSAPPAVPEDLESPF